MLYPETINPETLELLIRLMRDPELHHFVLVGGTALALQTGHRISVDLDLFSEKSFNENYLATHLHSKYKFELDFIARNTLKGEIKGIQIDCIAHQYPWIENPITTENIRLAGLADIAAMKLNAIAGNGTRIKDFIDIASLSHKLSFKNMLKGYELKYKSNIIIPLKALTYFDDINFNEPINMIGGAKYNWEKIEQRLTIMQKFPDRIFPKLQI